MASTHVGFIGLGNMGGRMTACLVRSGHAVLGYDVRADAAAAVGAELAQSHAAVADKCDIVLLSLPDSAVVESVVFGRGGLVAHARRGQVVVDLSTSAPDSTRRICAGFADKEASSAAPTRDCLAGAAGDGEHAWLAMTIRRSRAGPGQARTPRPTVQRIRRRAEPCTISAEAG